MHTSSGIGIRPAGRPRSSPSTIWRLGPLLALALLATACGSAGFSPAAGAQGPAPAAAVDHAAPSRDSGSPVSSGAVAPGTDTDATTPQGAGAAESAASEAPPLAPSDVEGGSEQSAPPASTAETSNSAPAVVEPLAPAPRQVRGAGPPPVTARYVAVLDEDSGALLYGQDEHARVAIASITKIATTLVALERAPDLDARVPVTVSGSAMAARDHSSIMGLEPGREVSLRTLLYGMMLPSGNDAAEQVAVALGGSRETYVDWMNQEVAALGLQDTHFVTPSGMDAPEHYSSAYDMALLGRVAMQNETFSRLAGAATYRGDGYTMSNLNRLIGSYPGADGIKIGLTRAAGRTIVASATRHGHRVYVSLLRSQDLPGDSAALFNWVWRSFEW